MPAAKYTLEPGQVWYVPGTLGQHKDFRKITKLDGTVVHYADRFTSHGLCSAGHFRRWIQGDRRAYGPAILGDESHVSYYEPRDSEKLSEAFSKVGDLLDEAAADIVRSACIALRNKGMIEAAAFLETEQARLSFGRRA